MNRNGYQPSFEIMNHHLKTVLQITRKHGLSPMIWSDMYFRMASSTGDYYDTDAHIPAEIIKGMPDDVQFVYWDYYHEDEGFYQDFLKRHKTFGSTPLFAGGIWTWNGIAFNYDKPFKSLNAAITACKREGIQEVFATLWGDDGAETNPFTGLLGIQLLAEHGYAIEIEIEKVKSRFGFCTGADMDAFVSLGDLDRPPGADDGFQLEPDNPSKYLLWQDPLLGLFDHQTDGVPLNEFYSTLETKLKNQKKRAGEWGSLFDVPIGICSVLSIKSELGSKMKGCYGSDDHDGLRKIANEDLPELLRRVGQLRRLYYEQWMFHNKPFGWEVMDMRYGGLSNRLETTKLRLVDYLEGRISSISELEDDRLPFTIDHRSRRYVRSNVYQKIVTPNVF
ncbi:hypothetical protein [Alkalihalobacillus sp. TS-13]|uniref:hypothetical protein n=1 Tax=Alkalihalobacillus sp. TS-13 TaxID=2842455 RepID=UPI001C86FFEA|nr:hypothetical protein [Alkalihalobacillus sp. TS-13]